MPNFEFDRPNKESKLKTFDSAIHSCRENICRQEAYMFFFKSEELCTNLLNVTYDKSAIGNVKKRDLKCCLPETDPVIMGYYIEPTNGLDEPTNSLKLTPIWSWNSGLNHFEQLGSPIPINPIEYYKYSYGMPINAYLLPNSLAQNFSHSLFQFNDDAISKDFKKAFVSYYEIKSIIENCDKVGITGSLVMTGNIIVEEDSLMARSACSKSFFTYRFVGFNLVSKRSEELPKQILKSLASVGLNKKQEILIKSNYIIKNGNIEGPFHNTPAETWATPCPPMWIESS
jgi:hypothetical protein